MAYTPYNKRKGLITLNQTRQLIDYFKLKAKGTRTPVLHKIWMQKALLIFILYRTGRRISEVIGRKRPIRMHGLRPIDIDFENNTITWSILKKNPVKKKKKDGKDRTTDAISKDLYNKPLYEETIPCDPKTIAAIKYWVEKWQVHYSDRIFKFDQCYMNRLIKRASFDLNIKLPGKKIIKDKEGKLYESIYWPSCHSFRHFFASNFLEENENNSLALPSLQEIMVHSSLAITKTYIHVKDDKKRDMINKANK